jgi:FtsP/CotA-like multicopper oxidase with cupredoxin domain
MFIVDPPEGRPPADEMVMVMAGMTSMTITEMNSTPSTVCRLLHEVSDSDPERPARSRLYVLNMIELDPAVSFHLHANFFECLSHWHDPDPSEKTDGDYYGNSRGHILEFSYRYPGKYMFHPHHGRDRGARLHGPV